MPIYGFSVWLSNMKRRNSAVNNFRDDLPSGCPPVGAREVTSEESVFRLVRNNPPTANDFQSQRQK